MSGSDDIAHDKGMYLPIKEDKSGAKVGHIVSNWISFGSTTAINVMRESSSCGN